MTPTMRRYLEGRLFEWVMATAMILLAVNIYLDPSVLGAKSFLLINDYVSGWCLSLFLLLFGIARFVALIANGRSEIYGPRTRAIAAVAGAILWGQFALAIVLASGPPSPGLPFWGPFVLAELYSAYRAETDART